jgi:hypothetical protein
MASLKSAPASNANTINLPGRLAGSLLIRRRAVGVVAAPHVAGRAGAESGTGHAAVPALAPRGGLAAALVDVGAADVSYFHGLSRASQDCC